MRPIKLQYSIPAGLALWTIVAGLLCSQSSCSVTATTLPGILGSMAVAIAISVAFLSGLPQINKVFRLPIWVLATAYFTAMGYLTVKTYTPSPLLPTLLYPAWLFWTVLGLVYAVSEDKISSTENNRPYKILRGAVWAVLGVAVLFTFSAWVLNLFILAQVLVFVACLGGWRFVVWLKESLAEDTK